jgi:hypothetical protein
MIDDFIKIENNLNWFQVSKNTMEKSLFLNN